MLSLQTSTVYTYSSSSAVRPARAAAPVELPDQTDAILLARMSEAIDMFLTTEQDLAGMLVALSSHCWQLTAVPARWQQTFLNVWKSVELVHAEASAHNRALSEMELRFVLALCREMRDRVRDARSHIAESAAD